MTGAKSSGGFDQVEADRLLCGIGKRTKKDFRKGVTITFANGYKLTLHGLNQVTLDAAVKRAKAARGWE